MNKRMDKKKQKRMTQTAATPATSPATAPAVSPVEAAAPATPKPSFYIQYQDQEYSYASVTDLIVEKCQSEGASMEDLKSLSIYLKPEDKKAYYTCADKSGSIDL